MLRILTTGNSFTVMTLYFGWRYLRKKHYKISKCCNMSIILNAFKNHHCVTDWVSSYHIYLFAQEEFESFVRVSVCWVLTAATSYSADKCFSLHVYFHSFVFLITQIVFLNTPVKSSCVVNKKGCDLELVPTWYLSSDLTLCLFFCFFSFLPFLLRWYFIFFRLIK